MRNSVLFSTMAILVFVCLSACSQKQADKETEQQATEMAQIQPANSIDDWEIRFDKAEADSSASEFTVSGDTLHIVAGGSGAAIYYKPEMKASGSFSAQGTFAQVVKSEHPEAYGLFIGGDSLQAESQHYLYFEVRMDGKYLIKRRVESETESIVGWTANAAIHSMSETWPLTNTLKITRDAEAVTFWVNETQVKQIPVSELQYTEGVVGLRINHNLNLKITDFGVQ